MTKANDFNEAFANAETVDGWSDPDMSLVDNGRAITPAFPVHVFGAFWEKWLTESAESKSAPVDYVAAALMSSAAGFIGNACLAKAWDGWTEASIFWACCIGNPSSSKTPAINAVMDLVRHIQLSLNPDHAEKLKEYKNKLELAEIAKKEWKKSLKGNSKKRETKGASLPSFSVPDKPIERRLIIMDSTVEMIAPLMLVNPKGLICFRDELSGWVGGLNQYKGNSGGDRQFYLEAYNGKLYVVDRVKLGLDGSITVPNLTISIIGGIQPEKFSRAVLGDVDDGLTARFMYFHPLSIPPKRPTVVPDDGKAVAALKKLQAVDFMQGQDDENTAVAHSWQICLDSAGENLFSAYRNRLYEYAKSASGHYLAYLGKNNGKVLRMALVIELLKWSASDKTEMPTHISEEALTQSIMLADEYFDPMARKVFDDAALPEHVRNATRLAKWIVQRKPKVINSRQVCRESGLGLKKVELVMPAIEELVQAGWLAKATDSKPETGRPRNDYLVNPKVWRHA